MGNVWKYGYDNNGQLTSRTDPDGGVIKIDYVLSASSRHLSMDSGKNGGKLSQSYVITTSHQNR
ncbi:RHS repeat domain-containing protein [Snodgrassella gandavensis]|uniref:RHS repeat domain-containing protein n=1 Tax=Snodgrassella gandavensis TaxID=2946698 RepID=UPI001EF4263C